MKKLNFQKLFCFISMLFILSCCIFYGTRFIKLYLENKKTEVEEKNTLTKKVKDNNSNNDNFKSVNGQNYFTGKEENNYLMYSNILWRIIKVNDDNSITAISDTSITPLAYGKKVLYKDSEIFKWLNKTDDKYSGILESSLNDISKYLQKTTTCTDKLDELSNNPCKELDNDSYITLLPVIDYLNIGSKDSYLVNNEFFYLSNTNSENKAWYADEEGILTLSTGTDIIGVRPVITIKSNVEYISGNGSKNNPYIIEKKNNYFGSYVKLGNDTWRIYEVNNNEVKLMLNDYLKVNNKNLTYKYSNINSYYDDYKQGSIAYYLNHTYLDSLSYKNILKETNWANGYYNSDTNYSYAHSLETTINSKVALLSIGNVFLNSELNNYHIMTGSKQKGSMIYTTNSNVKARLNQISSEINIVPSICIDKELLKKGNGTIDSPFEME